jgi:hypothetical protein
MATDADLRYYLFRPCKTMQELHDWCVIYLGIDFPQIVVHPDSNSSPLGLLWEIYEKCMSTPGEDEGAARYLGYASRGGYKTLLAATLEVLSLLHLGRDVAHMAAIETQAVKAQSYVKEACRRPYIRDFVVGDNERSIRLVRYYDYRTEHSITSAEYAELTDEKKARHVKWDHSLAADYEEKSRYVKVVICSMTGANSDHVPLFIGDELDVISNPRAFQESKSIPQGRNGMIPVTFYTSSRKSSIGIVQKEIDNATKSGLKVRHWNIIDVTQRCPEKRHLPGLPKLPLFRSEELLHHVDAAGFAAMSDKQKESYSRDPDAFAGCAKCKLYPMCRGTLATKQTGDSPLLFRIADTIEAFSDKDLDYAKAQLLCLRPSQKGKIYSRFDKTRHVKTPAEAYELVFGEPPPDSMGGQMMTKVQLTAAIVERELSWSGGMDFGDTHEFACPVGFRDGRRAFLMRCPGGAQLEPDQQIAICEPIKALVPDIYPDPSNPGMIRMFKRHGFGMKRWKKNAGSVAAGISTVQAMLSPILDPEPLFYIVVDVDSDPEMDATISQLEDYSWKLDAMGNPTGQPNKVNDDRPDAVRYWLMNVFGNGSNLVTATDTDDAAVGIAAMAPPTIGNAQANFMQEMVANLTGGGTQQGFKIEAPNGSGFQSYYAESGETAKATAKGKRGSLVWSIG